MFNKLKQFQDLRKRATDLQTTLAKETMDGSADHGKVKITINGNQHITQVMIDPSCMDNREKLQTSIQEATNDAITKIQKVMASKLQDMGGMDLAQEFGDMIKK